MDKSGLCGSDTEANESSLSLCGNVANSFVRGVVCWMDGSTVLKNGLDVSLWASSVFRSSRTRNDSSISATVLSDVGFILLSNSTW